MMDIKEQALEYNRRIKEALLTVYAALNKGQQKQLMKDTAVKELFVRYHVIPNKSEEEVEE